MSVSNMDSLIRRKVCQFVKECLDNKVCGNFQGYFEINSHYKGTCSNPILVKLPKVKLEYTRKSFRFSGAKIYNDLPKHLHLESPLNLPILIITAQSRNLLPGDKIKTCRVTEQVFLYFKLL